MFFKTFILAFIASILLAAPAVNAWCLGLWNGDNYSGLVREFHDNGGDEGCFNIPNDIAGNVRSFRYIPAAVSCSYTMWSGNGCTGDDLGSGSYTENAAHVGPPKSNARSFRIAGCYGTLPGYSCNTPP